MSEPLRIVQVGAGGMGRAWLRTLQAEPSVVLTGLVDLDVPAARRAADEHGYEAVPVAASLAELATQADAVIDVTVPSAHPTVSIDALRRGLPVLCEKPIAETVRESLVMAAAAEAYGQLLMVSQSRRYFRAVNALTRQLAQLGPVGTLTCEFFKAPRFGGFRERMAEPLLVDMAIHQFDLARKLLAADPVSVYCESYNPDWSWYDGNAAATAVFTFDSGARFTFSGSWCAPGLETSWNGSWRAVTAQGTVTWDGDDAPLSSTGTSPVKLSDEPEEIAGSLREFVTALTGGPAPQSEARTNIHSLAMVEAAVQSATTHTRVQIADILMTAYEAALSTTQDDQILSTLKSWPTPGSG